MAWMKARRRVRLSLTLWTVLWLLVFFTLSALGATGVFGKAEPKAVGGLTGVTFFCYLGILYVRVGSLRCLKRIRNTLQAHPWRLIPPARRPASKDVMGVPVHL
ncbi:hypothetical protein [Streptomyces sp. NPDC017993]|uniref:hypothetical protein n=1 Tax=Streptomyces sp. NPDC017993 TaxID=3365027 RepID=UPI0037B3720D